MNQRYLETVGCLHFPACREYVETWVVLGLNLYPLGTDIVSAMMSALYPIPYVNVDVKQTGPRHLTN